MTCQVGVRTMQYIWRNEMKTVYEQAKNSGSRRPTLPIRRIGSDMATGSRRPFSVSNPSGGPQETPRSTRDRHDPAPVWTSDRTSAANLHESFVPPAVGSQAPV